MEELAKKIYNDYITSNLTMEQVGEKYGKSRKQVSRLFKRYGLRSRPNKPTITKEACDVKAPESIRAFSDSSVSYYKLACDIGKLKEGAIFYHDKHGTGQGSLKLCWNPVGDYQNGCSGGSVVFPFTFVSTEVFEKVESPKEEVLKYLKPGNDYLFEIAEDNSFTINLISKKAVYLVKHENNYSTERGNTCLNT